MEVTVISPKFTPLQDTHLVILPMNLEQELRSTLIDEMAGILVQRLQCHHHIHIYTAKFTIITSIYNWTQFLKIRIIEPRPNNLSKPKGKILVWVLIFWTCEKRGQSKPDPMKWVARVDFFFFFKGTFFHSSFSFSFSVFFPCNSM